MGVVGLGDSDVGAQQLGRQRLGAVRGLWRAAHLVHRQHVRRQPPILRSDRNAFQQAAIEEVSCLHWICRMFKASQSRRRDIAPIWVADCSRQPINEQRDPREQDCGRKHYNLEEILEKQAVSVC